MRFELRPSDPSAAQARAGSAARFRGSRDNSSRLVGGVFFVLGLGLLAGGFFSGRHQYGILKHWPRVDATVIKSAVTVGRDEDSTVYGTEVEFQYRVEGKDYQTPAASSYKTSSYVEMKRQANIFATGTRHSLLYNPADPHDIRYDAGYNFSFFLAPVILGGMGIVFAGVGVLVWILFRAPEIALRCPSCNRPVEPGQEFCPHCATPPTVHSDRP